MGTEIYLKIDKLSVDWSKNHMGRDHGFLFQENDRKRIRVKGINYDEYGDPDDSLELMEKVLSRPLRQVVPRLELCGFDLNRAKQEYDNQVQDNAELHHPDEFDSMDFNEFLAFVRSHPLKILDPTYYWDVQDREKIMGRFTDEALLSRLPGYSAGTNSYSELTFFGELIGFLQPYTLLRLLAECHCNLDLEVTWEYGMLAESGWASESDFVGGARRTQTFMIATEGTSDAHILKHSFSLLRPEIADFFRFIDVTDRHPFPGTGNLLKFAEGLVKIDIQNQVLFLFDNDAEGYEAHQKMSQLSLPDNIRGVLLPTLDEFFSFPCQGPEGLVNSDINLKAAAIECYLDLNLKNFPPAKVIWTNLKKDLGVYQGALEYKDSYTKEFMAQTKETISSGMYDASRIARVLDTIVSECARIACASAADDIRR